MIHRIPNNKQQLFDRWAPAYDILFPSVFYQAIHKRLLEYVELPREAQVLDIGCGTSRLLDRLASQEPTLQATGLDFSAAMIRQARAHNRHRPRIIFLEGNATALPFGENQFDAVFNTLSFLHYDSPEQVFQQVSRVLRPNGRFYLVDITTRRQSESESAYIPVSPGGVRFYSPAARVRAACGRHIAWENRYD
ncbi:class I SAM-dependent methyltransferase [Microseira wollei]|uniref:UbiE/COQ5 methyltransferase n=1 Tax=Microseira wollei NIES-4236 TaxID=2530354 RepID=A0AAV3XFA2_9CYAN|nr:class I SAM-dependent methyltransferase [Microseira wollei]GET40168.1 UbiE/COQ5 methyltransferase [Microseira wollei NIES-4236]